MKALIKRARAEDLRRDRGSEIAEAAVVLPVLFLVLFSIYWFGQAFNIYGTINHAAREGARTAAVPACASCSVGCTWSGSNLPCDASVIAAVNSALIADHLNPELTQPFVPNPPPVPCPGAVPTGMCATSANGGFTICRNVALDQNSTAPQVCGVIVSFQYPYQLALPFSSLSNQQILLKAAVQMQGEQ
jgi:TadE-like protein